MYTDFYMNNITTLRSTHSESATKTNFSFFYLMPSRYFFSTMLFARFWRSLYSLRISNFCTLCCCYDILITSMKWQDLCVCCSQHIVMLLSSHKPTEQFFFSLFRFISLLFSFHLHVMYYSRFFWMDCFYFQFI